MRCKRLQNWEFVVLVGLSFATGNGAAWIAPQSVHGAFVAAKTPAPPSVASVMSVAKIFEEQGQTEKAIRLYRSIVAQHPDYVPAREKLEVLTREEGPETSGSVQALRRPLPNASAKVTAPVQLASTASQPASIPLAQWLPSTQESVSLPGVTSDPAVIPSTDSTPSTGSAHPRNVWVKTSHAVPVEPVLMAQAAPSRKSDSPWTTAESEPNFNDVRESRFSVIVAQRETSRRAQRTGRSGGVPAQQVSLSRSPDQTPDVLGWIEKLRDPDPMVRVGAVYRLGKMGPEARGAISSLEELLYDESDVIRIHAILALWKIDKRVPSVIDYYADIFKGNDKELKGLAKHVLREIGNGIPYGAAVIPMSDETNAAAQIAAAKTLCKVQKFNALSRLIFIHSLTKGDRNTRLLAAYAFASLAPRDDSSIQSLIQALDDQDGAVRVAATYALGCIGPSAERAAPYIMQFVVSDEYDSDLRDSAFHAIHAIDPALAKTIDLGGSEEAQPSE